MRTRLCDVLSIELPVIQASIGPWSSVDLTAAVSNAGGLGSLGTALRSPSDVVSDIRALRARTDRPFAVNFTASPFDEQAFAAALAEHPPVVSYALGEPGDLALRAHEAGVLFVQQVHTREQALAAAAAQVDVLIAQGAEAGGFGGVVSTLVLVPQVVDAVPALPVAAAGGIADGRGLAAALALGAHGANVGTRFLAAEEAKIPHDWQRALAGARSEDAVKAEFAPYAFPPAGRGGYEVLPRVLRTRFVDEWNDRGAEAAAHTDALRSELMGAARAGRLHELVPFTGQSVGLVDAPLPAAQILQRLVDEAAAILQSAAALAA